MQVRLVCAHNGSREFRAHTKDWSFEEKKVTKECAETNFYEF